MATSGSATRSDERIFETRLPIVGVVALLAALVVVPLFAGTYWLDVLNRIGIAIIGAIGLNILVGFTGQISIGHAAFLAVGAYGTAILGSKAGLPFWLAIPLAGAADLAVRAGLRRPVAAPEGALPGHRHAGGALHHHVRDHPLGVDDQRRARLQRDAGLGVRRRPLDSDERVFYLIYALVIPAVLFAKNLFRTRVGRAFIAVRDRDVAAAVIGVSLYRYKLLAFVISSFYAGVAGGLMAYHSRIVFPDAFTLLVAIDYLAMIIIGGMGSIIGSIYGAVFMTLLPEVLKLSATSLTGVYPNAFGLIASARDIVFGLADHLLPDVRAHGARADLAAVPELLEAVALCVLSPCVVTVRTDKEAVMRRITSSLVLLRHARSARRSAWRTLPADAQNIKIGNLVDLTGPTSDQGKDIAQGRNDAVAYINEKGGVNGRKLELVSVEYGFQPPRAVAAYKKFVQDDKVLLVLGYGTPDTEALRPFITKDKVPYISGSYSGHLTDPKQTPYNFPGGIDYTSQIRIFLNWVKEGWKDTSRKPKVAFIFADNAYGRAPIEAGRAYAKEIGVDLVDEEVIPTMLTDATSQLLTMKTEGPRLRLHQHQHPVGAGGAEGLLQARAEDQVRGQQLRHRRAHARPGARGGRGRVRHPGRRLLGRERPRHEDADGLAPEAPSQRHPRLAVHAGLAVDPHGRRGHQARGPEPDRRGREEGAREPQGVGHVGHHPALHLHERGPSADQPRAAGA